MSKPRRVLVCGGRDYGNYAVVSAVLRLVHDIAPIEAIIEGGATGADELARQWAKSQGISVMTFQADWANLGRSAGPRRNAEMLRKGQPVLVVAFPGGRGTANMVAQAAAADVPVYEVSPP